MDSFEWNKVAAAILVGLLLFMGVNMFTESVFPEHEVEIAGGEHSADAGEGPATEIPEPEANIMALIVDANISAGERSFRKCQACHTGNEGGDNRVGPNLYGVVGADIATHPGYSYSGTLTGLEGNWTYEKLNEFLASPMDYAPGTKMTFAGLKKADERANVIAYLRLQSANPLPLPEVPVEEPAAEEAPTAEEASASGN